jgi:hypothetical protein
VVSCTGGRASGGRPRVGHEVSSLQAFSGRNPRLSWKERGRPVSERAWEGEISIRAPSAAPVVECGEAAYRDTILRCRASTPLRSIDPPQRKSKGRSERLPTGPCPLHQECPAITCRQLPQQNNYLRSLYNDEVTKGKSIPLSFCNPPQRDGVIGALRRSRCRMRGRGHRQRARPAASTGTQWPSWLDRGSCPPRRWRTAIGSERPIDAPF